MDENNACTGGPGFTGSVIVNRFTDKSEMHFDKSAHVLFVSAQSPRALRGHGIEVRGHATFGHFFSFWVVFR